MKEKDVLSRKKMAQLMTRRKKYLEKKVQFVLFFVFFILILFQLNVFLEESDSDSDSDDPDKIVESKAALFLQV